MYLECADERPAQHELQPSRKGRDEARDECNFGWHRSMSTDALARIYRALHPPTASPWVAPT